jgi:hypothetical protein
MIVSPRFTGSRLNLPSSDWIFAGGKEANTPTVRLSSANMSDIRRQSVTSVPRSEPWRRCRKLVPGQYDIELVLFEGKQDDIGDRLAPGWRLFASRNRTGGQFVPPDKHATCSIGQGSEDLALDQIHQLPSPVGRAERIAAARELVRPTQGNQVAKAVPAQ